MSGCGKGGVSRQVWSKEVSESKPFDEASKSEIYLPKPEIPSDHWDELTGNVCFGLVAIGVKMARTWTRLLSGTWEPSCIFHVHGGADEVVVVLMPMETWVERRTELLVSV